MNASDGDTLRDPSPTVNRKCHGNGREVRELTAFARGRYDWSMSRVTCPNCRMPAPWDGNPHRPFCSLSCRLIDLGDWLDERYRIPNEPASEDDASRVP